MTMVLRTVSGRRYLLLPLAALALVVLSHLLGLPGRPLGGFGSGVDRDPYTEAGLPAGELLTGSGRATGANAATAADTDRRIAFWQARAAADPRSDLAWQYLGELFIQKARETGDAANIARAEEAFGKALAIAAGNSSARAGLARVLATQHRFDAAAREALAVVRANPSATGALATLADALIETGDLDGADAAVRILEERGGGPAVTVRRARLAFLRGDTPRAAQLAHDAAIEAAAEGSSGAELAFYHYAEGEYRFMSGALDAADAAYGAALAAFPGDPLAQAGHGRVAFARGDTDLAITHLEAALAVVPRPELLGYLGDLLTLRGDSRRAEQFYAQVDLIAQLGDEQTRRYNRDLVLFVASHGRDAARAVAMAEAELAVRGDVYGHDALAWALHAAGRDAEALVEARAALAVGTLDPRILYHAGAIELANGLEADGRAHLRHALALNAGFDPLGARAAREALEP